MAFHLFDAPAREPSQFTGFSGNTIDRQSEKRDDQSIARALADPSARTMLVAAGRIHLKAGAAFDPWFTVPEAETLSAKLGRAVLLGHDAHGPVLAAPAGIAVEDLPDALKAIDYRSVHVQGLIDPEALGALAQGGALLSWHGTHRFCGRCGHETAMAAGGYKRVCPGCKAEHFPRTDPVAIMLAVTRDKCLLGRSPHFPPGMYSCLAGFVEPGETIENAVRRETFEESGIRLGRVLYHASQPWPFPYSLMIGCYGEAVSDDITTDTAELEDVRWFGRDEVLAILEGHHPGGIVTPPPSAIANLLMRDWARSA